MLFLLFHIGADRYALPAREVVEVLPILNLKAIPHAPPGVVGVFSYHGTPVPVVDLTLLATGARSAFRMTTRIAVTVYQAEGESGTSDKLIGLMAEQLTETYDGKESDFVSAGVSPADAPYLGDVISDPNGVIQRLNISELFPPALRASLYANLEENAVSNASGT